MHSYSCTVLCQGFCGKSMHVIERQSNTQHLYFDIARQFIDTDKIAMNMVIPVYSEYADNILCAYSG